MTPGYAHPLPGMGGGVAPRATPAVIFNAAVVRAWLAAPSDHRSGGTNTEALGIDADGFGRGLGGFLSTVEDLFHACPRAGPAALTSTTC